MLISLKLMVKRKIRIRKKKSEKLKKNRCVLSPCLMKVQLAVVVPTSKAKINFHKKAALLAAL